MVNAEEIYPERVASTAVKHEGKYGDRQWYKFFVSGAKSFDGRLTAFLMGADLERSIFRDTTSKLSFLYLGTSQSGGQDQEGGCDC